MTNQCYFSIPFISQAERDTGEESKARGPPGINRSWESMRPLGHAVNLKKPWSIHKYGNICFFNGNICFFNGNMFVLPEMGWNSLVALTDVGRVVSRWLDQSELQSTTMIILRAAPLAKQPRFIRVDLLATVGIWQKRTHDQKNRNGARSLYFGVCDQLNLFLPEDSVSAGGTLINMCWNVASDTDSLKQIYEVFSSNHAALCFSLDTAPKQWGQSILVWISSSCSNCSFAKCVFYRCARKWFHDSHHFDGTYVLYVCIQHITQTYNIQSYTNFRYIFSHGHIHTRTHTHTIHIWLQSLICEISMQNT